MTKKVYDANGVEITTSVQSGDIITYVITPSLPLTTAGPAAAVELRDTMQGAQTYVAGSLNRRLAWTLPVTDPSGTFSNTLIGTWTPPTIPGTTGSTMTQVYGGNGFEARMPVVANFSITTPAGPATATPRSPSPWATAIWRR